MGARVASGVVLISTKRGEARVTRINLSASVGLYSLEPLGTILLLEQLIRMIWNSVIT